MLTNIVRAFCLLVDVTVLALAAGAVVHWRRGRIARVRRSISEPRSHVRPVTEHRSVRVVR